MKKFIYSSALALASAFSLQAQTVIFSEDFQGGMPATFSLFNVDARTPATQVAYVNAAWIVRDDLSGTTADSVAMSTSWYSPAGAANDWMVTPAITIPAGANVQLTWDALAYDADFPDGYEVRLFTAAPTAANLMTSTVLTTVAAENSSWTQRSVSLSGSAGQTVYVAFRNTSNDMFVLAVDNIVVSTVPNYDLRTVNALPDWEYSRKPLVQYSPDSLFVSVENLGAMAATNAGATVDVIGFNQAASVYSATSTLATIASGATTSRLSLGVFNPTVADLYVLGYEPVADSADQNTNNDLIVKSIDLDSTYARWNGNTIDAVFGFGEAPAYFGITVDVAVAQAAASMDMYMAAGFTGTRVAGILYATDASGTPTSIVAATDTVPADTSAGWINMTFPANTTLAPGRYVVAVVELDSTLTLGFTNNIFRNGTAWVSSPTTPWDNLEAFGAQFSKMPMIQLHMFNAAVAVDCSTFMASTSTTDATGAAATDGTATCTTTGGTGAVMFAWSNSQTTATATGLAPATYTVTATDANGCTASASAVVSFVSSVDMTAEGNYFNVFPNPAADQINVQAQWGYTSNARVNVVAADGRIVYRQNVRETAQTQITIDAADFAAGVYFVQIYTDKEVFTRRIVKK